MWVLILLDTLIFLLSDCLGSCIVFVAALSFWLFFGPTCIYTVHVQCILHVYNSLRLYRHHFIPRKIVSHKNVFSVLPLPSLLLLSFSLFFTVFLSLTHSDLLLFPSLFFHLSPFSDERAFDRRNQLSSNTQSTVCRTTGKRYSIHVLYIVHVHAHVHVCTCIKHMYMCIMYHMMSR